MRKIIKMCMVVALGAAMIACVKDADDDSTPKIPFKLTVDVTDITAYSAKVVVESADVVTAYYTGYISKAEYDQNGGTPAGAAAYVENLMKKMAEERGKTVADMVALKSIKGSTSFECNDVTPDTDYVVFAFAWNTEAKAVATPVVKAFKTAKEPVGMTITLKSKDIAGKVVGVNTLRYEGYVNEVGTKFTSFSYSFPYADKDQLVPFTIVYGESACTVTYKDIMSGEDMKVIFTLNADGFPTASTKFYASDGAEAGEHVTFTYENKLLTKAVNDHDPKALMTLFEATYADSNYATVFAGFIGDFLNVTSGNTANTFGIDPNNFFFTISENPISNSYMLASCCGLLPRAKHMPTAFELGGDTIPVTTTVEDGKLMEYSTPPIDVVYLYAN